MAINPQQFFRFAGRNTPLLLELFRRREGCTEADLRELIMTHRSEGDATPTTIVDQLQSLHFIEPIPDATASFELTPPIRQLLASLLREHRLTSAKVLQGYLEDLGELRSELAHATREKHRNQICRIVEDISQLLERLREDSHANREAIILQVLKLKSNREQMTIKERFQIINRIWERYLEPLRDLIDIKKAMDSRLDELKTCLVATEQAMIYEELIVRELSRCRARLLRLRRDVAEDFHESIREVEPLYFSLKRDSELVRGAALALERIDRDGLDSLRLPEMLALPVWRVEGLVADSGISSYLHGVKAYTCPEQSPLPEAKQQPSSQTFVRFSEIREHLQTALPVEDVLSWLLEQYPQSSLDMIVKTYGRIYLGDLGSQSFGTQEKSYPLPGATLIARPLRLETCQCMK